MQKQGFTPFSGSLLELTGTLVAGVGLLALLFVALEHRSVFSRPTRHATISFEESASARLNAADESFLRRATAQEAETLALAQRGVTETVNGDVRAFASELLTEHRTIVAALENLARRKQVRVSAMVPTAVRPGVLPVRAAAKPDINFLDRVLAYEGDDSELFEQAALQCTDLELRSFAQKTLAALQAHRAQAKQLRQTVS
jgi:putative membrane protein